MFRRILVLGLTYMLASTATAQTPPDATGSASDEPGVHFILLMDESGDMSGGGRETLAAALPQLLFHGRVGDAEVRPALPRYQPGRDQVSAVYFTILKNDNGGCKPGRKKMSALPDDMFSFEGEWSVRDENELRSKVAGGWKQPCRFPGDYSPIASAPLLVLPYLQNQLKHDRLYSRTILIVATNSLFNTKVSPSIELDTFRRNDVSGTDEASRLSHEVSNLFYFDASPGWNIEILKNRAYFMISEAAPQTPPASALSHLRSISLDRHAVSPDKLRIVPDVPRSGELWVLSKGGDAGFNFLPLSLEMRFRDAGGGPWRVGGKTLPDTIAVDLKDCGAPVCRREEDKVIIPLFEAAGDGLTLSPDDPELGPGLLSFDVGLRYRNKIYDHVFVKIPGQQIDLTPTRAATLPGFFFLLPSVTLDNDELASEWAADADGVTTQDEAKNQILVRRWLYYFLIALALIAFVGYLFLYHYRRRFEPRLEWWPSSEVVVDFNRPAASRLLVGALKVVNEGDLPLLGRLLGRFVENEQPTRKALLSLNYNFFKQSGLVLSGDNPIGFIRPQDAEEESSSALDLYAEEAVSDGKQLYIFLAADTIRDYLPPAPSAAESKDFQIDLSVNMDWRAQELGGDPSLFRRLRSRLGGADGGGLSTVVACPLTVKPEEQRKPLVTFRRSDEQTFYFRKGEKVAVGKFVFSSQSEHNYAQPFEWDKYAVETYRDNRPLAGSPVALGSPRVSVPPRDEVEVPVYLVCDGETVPNPGGGETVPGPDAAYDVYDFKLVGDFHADSAPGFHSATLYRDPTVAEIELTLLYPEPKREIFWTKDGAPHQRLLLDDGRSAEEREIKDSTVRLDARGVEFEVGDGRTPDLLTLRFGNSGKANCGVVTVAVSTELVCDDVTRASIRMLPGQRLEDLLNVYLDEEVETGAVSIGEGDAPQTRDIRIQPGLISKVQGAVVPADKLAARIRLDILVRDDFGRERRRAALYIHMPLKLEQLPGSNWLCIDFGTSAITAALGTGREGGVTLLPLQEIHLPGGPSFSKYDLNNAEQGNPHLLPSWVVCDSDIRTDRGTVCRPGFPAYYRKDLTLTPGEPDFVGLPATSTQIERQPERVIYSLKSWLATATPSIRLRAPIKYKQNGREIESDALPLRQVVKSGLAALAEAYVLVDRRFRADRVVICHPNTFTHHHRDLLRDIAFSVFAPPDRLGIPLEDRVQLLSESDAVAFFYCRQQKRERPRSGAERILVYDFGAGTLDLSLINVEWKMKADGSCDPVRWDIEGQLGVPVAGNHIDELLARITDELLGDWRLEGHSAVEYRFPIVRPESFVAEDAEEFATRHHRAILRLWGWIREAKHEWDGQSALNIKVGTWLGGVKGAEGIVVQKSIEKMAASPPEDRAGLWTDDKYIYLSIPAKLVHEHPRMEEFIGFVTGEVIDELCGSADIPPGKIDTVIVSGRGALWPGLREAVWGRFPAAEKPNLGKQAMKSAVVRGAIARQDMAIEVNDKRWKAKLGVLKNYDEILVPEDDWHEAIDLSGSPSFRLVQVNLKRPAPLRDLKPGSLRKHFYINLTPEIRRLGEWERTREVLITKEVRGDGKLAIFLKDRRGHRKESVFAETRAAEVKTSPPWPMGPDYMLEPEEERHQENDGDDQTNLGL